MASERSGSEPMASDQSELEPKRSLRDRPFRARAGKGFTDVAKGLPKTCQMLAKHSKAGQWKAAWKEGGVWMDDDMPYVGIQHFGKGRCTNQGGPVS